LKASLFSSRVIAMLSPAIRKQKATNCHRMLTMTAQHGTDGGPNYYKVE
jgi:hypothetical protein